MQHQQTDRGYRAGRQEGALHINQISSIFLQSAFSNLHIALDMNLREPFA